MAKKKTDNAPHVPTKMELRKELKPQLHQSYFTHTKKSALLDSKAEARERNLIRKDSQIREWRSEAKKIRTRRKAQWVRLCERQKALERRLTLEGPSAKLAKDIMKFLNDVDRIKNAE